ncbi:MAG: type II toxin-antitoxin system RelE family toxin [Gaiellales bacterium]
MSSDAQRMVRSGLPSGVALALLALALGSLARNPRGIGTPLSGVDDGHWRVKRREYSLRYEIDDSDHVVRIVAIEPADDLRLR